MTGREIRADGLRLAGCHGLPPSQSFDAGDLKTAKTQLIWVAENGKNEARDLARLRLAAVQLDEQAYDEALKQLEAVHAAAFDARFLE